MNIYGLIKFFLQYVCTYILHRSKYELNYVLGYMEVKSSNGKLRSQVVVYWILLKMILF